jgi:hypothetical protein
VVEQDGVEGALKRLFKEGVYLTLDEFKGRKPVLRGNTTIETAPNGLRNPFLGARVPRESGGSGGVPSMVAFDLAFVRDCAINNSLLLATREGGTWVKAVWLVPGSMAIFRLLEFSAFGEPPRRWFSQVAPGADGLHPRYRWSGYALHWGSLAAGVTMPTPRHVGIDDPVPIARWMAETRDHGHTPYIHTFASSAVRLCRAAFDKGINIAGSQFVLGGEPSTRARLEVLRSMGARGFPHYGSAETGRIGAGCLDPDAADDMHLLHDLHAVIQPGKNAQEFGLPPLALLMTSLRTTAPMILLNVSLGDQAVMDRRPCGCSLERLGWTTHIHAVRSDDKLTAGGMNFLDTNVVRLLEDVLPGQFGGTATDYQLVEEEDSDWNPALKLLIHPAVGEVDPTAVAERFLSSLSAGSGVERVMGFLWRSAKLIQVERKPPFVTPAGKILHLHRERGGRKRV